MPVNLKTKPSNAASTPTTPASKPAAKPAAKAAPVGGLSFLKKGKAAQETMAQEELKQEMKQKGQVRRYWIPEDKEGQITFLDGAVSDGVLDIPFFYEHNVNMNGKWGNFFICTQDTEPCPICEGGANHSYVGVMTVIDHSEYKSSDGKVYKDQVRLFVAKRDTIKLLQKKAVKLGGLRGVKFDVSRTGDKSASVGNVFDLVEQYSDEELVAAYKDNATPLNYDEILAAQYLPAKELRKLGFGSMSSPPVGSADGDEEDYKDAM